MAEEKNFENRLVKKLAERGIYKANTPIQKMKVEQRGWYFKVWGGGFQANGIPDFIMNINGYFLGVELKAPNGRPSDLQIKNIDMINKSNGIGIILYPKDEDKFFEFIDKKLLTTVDISC